MKLVLQKTSLSVMRSQMRMKIHLQQKKKLPRLQKSKRLSLMMAKLKVMLKVPRNQQKLLLLRLQNLLMELLLVLLLKVLVRWKVLFLNLNLIVKMRLKKPKKLIINLTQPRKLLQPKLQLRKSHRLQKNS